MPLRLRGGFGVITARIKWRQLMVGEFLVCKLSRNHELFGNGYRAIGRCDLWPYAHAMTDAAYTNKLLDADQKSIEQFDKAVMSMSAGALAISIAFLNDIVGEDPSSGNLCLFGAWAFWALSIALIMASFFTSSRSIRRIIAKGESAISNGWAVATHVTTVCGGLAFLVGVTLMLIFVGKNI